MRFLLCILALPLMASPIVNSTSVQTTCEWVGFPPAPPVTLNDSSGLGSSQVSCPAGYLGPNASAGSTVNGLDAIATASISEAGIGSANAQANAGFEASGIAVQTGDLALGFITT